MRGNNEAEAVIVFRAESDAAEELADIREETEGIEQGFAGLNRSMVAGTLGFLGLSFGAKELVDNFQEVTTSNASVAFALDLLGPAAEKAHDDMSREFRGIASDVASTEREVSEAFQIIITNSGGIAPSIEELTGAFDLARLAGIDFEDAAKIIGAALQGNLEPLEQLLDESGRRSIVSLASALAKAADNADAAITPINRLSAAYRGLSDELVSVETDTGEIFDSIQRDVDATIGAFERLFGAKSLLEQLREDQNPILGPLGIEQTLVPDFANTNKILGGVIGIGGGGSTPIVFNINALQVGSLDEFAGLLTRQIMEKLRNQNRNGTNVSDK